MAELRCLPPLNCLVLSPPSALIWRDQNEVEESEICRVNEEEAVAKTGCELVSAGATGVRSAASEAKAKAVPIACGALLCGAIAVPSQ